MVWSSCWVPCTCWGAFSCTLTAKSTSLWRAVAQPGNSNWGDPDRAIYCAGAVPVPRETSQLEEQSRNWQCRVATLQSAGFTCRGLTPFCPGMSVLGFCSHDNEKISCGIKESTVIKPLSSEVHPRGEAGDGCPNVSGLNLKQCSWTHGPALRQVSPGSAPGDPGNDLLGLSSSVLATGHTERQLCLAGLGVDRQTDRRSQMFVMFAVFMEGFTYGPWNRSRHGYCCESVEEVKLTLQGGWAERVFKPSEVNVTCVLHEALRSKSMCKVKVKLCVKLKQLA